VLLTYLTLTCVITAVISIIYTIHFQLDHILSCNCSLKVVRIIVHQMNWHFLIAT